jgi:hypothetical protein
MKKYYAVEVSEYECGDIVDKVHIVKTSHPENLYKEYAGNTTIAFNIRKATWKERRAYRKANN